MAERILASSSPPEPDAAVRNAIQDVLWAGHGAIEIPRKTRREIARNLDLGDLVFKPGRFMALLDRLWVLGTPLDPWSDGSSGLRARIDRHMFRNPGDWSAADLFEELGAFEAGDARFGKFLEGLACADVIPDEPAQRRVADAVNQQLRRAGAALRETGTDGGYPVFSITSARPRRTRQPKNLIFASPAKPDIRFADAIDNDIEIVGNADDVLVYDRPIGADGLRWRDLQAWWSDAQQIACDEQAKRTLYRRLLSSLPGNSPPQRNLFALYHEIHAAAVRDLPALLPEVWLHWDHKTARERGPDALLRFRMDFPASAAPRPASRPRSRRPAPLRQPRQEEARPRPVRRQRTRRPGPEAQRVRGIPLRRRRASGPGPGPRRAPAVLRGVVPPVRRERSRSELSTTKRVAQVLWKSR
ncbi:MAG: hypothetical protein M3Y33_03250 [Actinomycetota bacterium]|nr:hypothetical protein [Actinomycetota bacterium]